MRGSEGSLAVNSFVTLASSVILVVLVFEDVSATRLGVFTSSMIGRLIEVNVETESASVAFSCNRVSASSCF